MYPLMDASQPTLCNYVNIYKCIHLWTLPRQLYIIVYMCIYLWTLPSLLFIIVEIYKCSYLWTLSSTGFQDYFLSLWKYIYMCIYLMDALQHWLPSLFFIIVEIYTCVSTYGHFPIANCALSNEIQQKNNGPFNISPSLWPFVQEGQ